MRQAGARGRGACAMREYRKAAGNARPQCATAVPREQHATAAHPYLRDMAILPVRTVSLMP